MLLYWLFSLHCIRYLTSFDIKLMETGTVWRVTRVFYNQGHHLHIILCGACLCKRSKVTVILNVLERKNWFSGKKPNSWRFQALFCQTKWRVKGAHVHARWPPDISTALWLDVTLKQPLSDDIGHEFSTCSGKSQSGWGGGGK